MIGKLKDWAERAAGAFPLRFWSKLFRLAVRKRHRHGDEFLTFHTRPKRAADLARWSDHRPDLPTVAVVLQGPLLLADDFTVETIRLYHKTFPGCPLIVSTWEGEDSAAVARVREAGADVLLNPKPKLAGPANINLQLTSALAGIQRAAGLGAAFVLKSRTDHRFYAANIPALLVRLIQEFPVRGGSEQTGRLVHLSLGSSKYTMYSLSDMFVFGRTADMVTFWSAPRKCGTMPVWRTIGDIARDRCTPEVYLATEFLGRIGRPLAWTIADSWDAYADHFCVVDAAAVDLFWPKYGFDHEHRFRRYDGVYTDKELTFAEWLNLYVGRANKGSGFEAASDLGVAAIVFPPPGATT